MKLSTNLLTVAVLAATAFAQQSAPAS